MNLFCFSSCILGQASILQIPLFRLVVGQVEIFSVEKQCAHKIRKTPVWMMLFMD